MKHIYKEKHFTLYFEFFFSKRLIATDGKLNAQTLRDPLLLGPMERCSLFNLTLKIQVRWIAEEIWSGQVTLPTKETFIPKVSVKTNKTSANFSFVRENGNCDQDEGPENVPN